MNMQEIAHNFRMRIVMAIEIERKFLVVNDEWRKHVVKSRHVRQAYLARGKNTSLRIRIVDERLATITIKSTGARLSRQEFEYSVPTTDAETLVALSEGGALTKTRHDVPFAGLLWEVDVFEGDHAGLIIGEVELLHENQIVHLPSWVGREITSDERFSNSRLAQDKVRLALLDTVER